MKKIKILALNGSPQGKQGKTDIILQALLKGMETAGASIETVYLNQQKINHCLGCMCCWMKTPGKCILQDDMAPLLEKLKQADCLIYATPLYCFTMTGLMKNFLDRGLPLSLPAFEKSKASSARATLSERFVRSEPQKVLLISSCGFPEILHFDPLLLTIQRIAQEHKQDYLGAILKTSSGLLKLDCFQDRVTEYLQALYTAGVQLVQQNQIDPLLLKKLHQAWLSPEDACALMNTEFQKLLHAS
jgi:multimeric flavodoxin WrbA